MKNKLLFLILIVLIGSFNTSCKKADAEDLGFGDASADDLILPNFTFMDLNTGNKIGERISRDEFHYKRYLYPPAFETWAPQNGDIFFFRGNIAQNNQYYDENIYGNFFAIVPLEPEFYWNGVGLYYDGFLYKITSTENGPRIYNQGLWTIDGYCLIVQASSSLALPENGINAEMMSKIHKVKVRRGHLKAALMNPNIDGNFTPPGLMDKFYANQGKQIRPDIAGEYVRAEDFIEKIDANNGYFQSRTPDLTIKKVYFGNDPGSIDCSKVY